ncbi:MAG: adenylate cyclase [Lachnospiraceae bacterium]|nr:adenylate cyclase [Lachnospiraceae bacterium]
MATEIERKFLVSEFDPKQFNILQIHKITQYYIMDAAPEMRIRRKTTVKGQSEYDPKSIHFFAYKSDGSISREEHEFMIPEAEYHNIFNYFLDKIKSISKTRYVLEVNGARAEVDVYEGNLNGLITAEVEFISMERAQEFLIPDWFAEEVTYDKRYKNKNLASVKNFLQDGVNQPT